MNTFYTHIQPNIIKFSDDESLPEKIRCRYAINYNVWGIDYFFENYLLQESNDGIYMILNENRFSFLLEDSLSDQDVLDIPRLYVLITDDFLNNSNKFQEFITRAAKDNEIYGVGINGFKPGVDYYINTTLFNYLSNLQGKSSPEDYQDQQENTNQTVIDDGNDNIFGAMTFGAAEVIDGPVEYYTRDEAYEHNLGLPGAISTNTIKILAQPAKYYTLEEITEHNDALDIWDENTVKKITYANVENLIIRYVINEGRDLNVYNNVDIEIPEEPILHYTQEEIDAHNATLDIWDENTIKEEATDIVYYTFEEVEEYNGNLEGAVHEGDIKPNGPTIDPIFRFAHRTLQGTLLQEFESQKIITESDILDYNYYSSDENVARVDLKTGEVQLLNPGMTQITCMFDGDDKYKSASASYLLVVIEEEIIDINLLDAANKLPNYLDKNGNITKYFVDLSGEILRDYTNVNYYYNKNKLLENHFSESELNNFYQGISNLILTYSEIQNSPEIFNTNKNQIYNIVLKYFASSQVDDASIALNTVLNSVYTTTTTNSSCGCGTGMNTTSDISQPCSALYSQAMQLYIKQMFGDPEFYEDWFTIILTDTERLPNDILIETLQLFVREFISIDYNLDVNQSKTSYNCECEDKISLNNSSLEYKKLNNFLQILDWVNNEQLDANVNKIKIYGKAFGELLPKLQF